MSQRSQPGSTSALIAWAFYDFGSSGFSALIQTFIFATYFAQRVAGDKESGTAYWGNTVGVAGLVVALCAPVLGAIADQGRRRKRWLGVTTGICIVATAALWFIQPGTAYLWPAMVLVGIATIGSEFAGVFYNAMLPELAPSDRIGRWSGWGWALGYIGGLACLLIALAMFIQDDPWWEGLDTSRAQHVRATFILTAVWFLVFAIPMFVWVPDPSGAGKPIARAVRDGLGQLWDSVRHARRYKGILRFLVAHMLYADALATVFALGGVYAVGTFGMDEKGVLLFGIGLNVTAGIGAAGFAWLDDWIGPKRTIVWALIGLMVTSGAILAVQSTLLFWVVGLTLGLFVGPVQAASRSYLGRAAPPEVRNEMFGLYALSGKATSFFGPMMVGWLTLGSGSQRVGMAAVVVMFSAGFLVVLAVPGAPTVVSPDPGLSDAPIPSARGGS